MASKTHQKLIIAAVLLLAIGGGFAIYAGAPTWFGTDVILATAPVDPFDPLRGQYMTVNYEIARIDTDAATGDTVYVALAPDDEGVWRSQGISTTPPEGVFIKGTVSSRWGNNIDFGIEQFFMERGSRIEERADAALVRIDSRGNARIISLLHEGEPVEIVSS